MGLDARVRYTKRVIKESIVELLHEKPFHKLRLTEVCQRAEINRATFYKHYKDLYDWKEQLEQECLQRTAAILDNCDLSDMQGILAQQFSDMKENAELYELISSHNFESNVLETVVSMILKKAESETQKSLFCSETAYRRKWDCYFAIHGCLGVIGCWIGDGMRESPELLAAYYAENMKRFLLSQY